MARISQKQVENWFYDMCRDMKIPLIKDRGSNYKYRTGALMMGYTNGRMVVQFVHPKSSSRSDFSGYLTAREMYDWMSSDRIKGMYTRQQKFSRECLKRDEARDNANK